MPKPLAAALVLALAAAPPALAQQGPSPAALRWFDSFDQNKDGVMSADEVRSVSAKLFGRIDANGDGVLTAEEYIFGIPEDREDEIARARLRFGIMDRDGDAKATPEEFTGFGLRVIELADTNGDGRLTRAEFATSVTPSQ